MRDFLNIMRAHGYYKESEWNRTESIYSFPNGSQIEFFSADQPTKLRGGRRDHLFINEANNITYSAYSELEIRTRQTVWADWNPTSPFWWYEDVMPHNDVDFLTLTYKDNETVEEQIIKSIESRKYSNPGWYKVYALGELGTLEGVIVTNWEIIRDVPKDARLERRALDFGYTNDPSVLEDIYRWNNAFVVDERIYASGLSNRRIADMILALPDQEILTVADSAEPKSIDEIKGYGVYITGAEKGQGSVMQGIQQMQDQKLYVTERSVSTIKDLRNWQWKVDKAGKPLNVPNHEFSHAPDAIRYGLTHILGRKILGVDDIAM